MTFGPGSHQSPMGAPQQYPSTASHAYSAPTSLTPPGYGAPVGYGTLPAYAAPAPQSAVPQLPVPTVKGRHTAVWLWVVLGFLLLLVAAYMLLGIGSTGAVVGMILALVPLAIVVTAALLIDRWEPEPRSLVLFALGWGGIAAVAISLIVGIAVAFALPPTAEADALMTVIEAPVVEELAKGLGLLILVVMGKRAFDGPVDGIVYAMLIAAGFAFTENIQYFGQALADGVDSLTLTFFLRGIMSPFAHAMFTAVTGFCVGLAVRQGNRGNVVGMFLLGWVGAACLHALWNGSAVFGDLLALYFAIQVPLFILFIVGIILLLREESKLTRMRLSDYAAAGWFTPQEVNMLATRPGRRAALAWAGSLGGGRGREMKQFIVDATELAAVRQRAISGRDPQAGADEWVLLNRTVADRQALLAR